MHSQRNSETLGVEAEEVEAEDIRRVNRVMVV